MRHLLALSRNRWKPVPYLFVNLMELTIQSSFNMPWNWKQILPWEGGKPQNDPLSSLCGWRRAGALHLRALISCSDTAMRCVPRRPRFPLQALPLVWENWGVGQGFKVRSGLLPKSLCSPLLHTLCAHHRPVPWGMAACRWCVNEEFLENRQGRCLKEWSQSLSFKRSGWRLMPNSTVPATVGFRVCDSALSAT